MDSAWKLLCLWSKPDQSVQPFLTLKKTKKNQSDFDTFQSLGQLLFSMAEKKKIKYVNSSPLHGKYMTDTYTTWSLELVVLVLCFPARSGETWLPSI